MPQLWVECMLEKRFYAQEGEDRRLWKALSDNIAHGHYVDIGAYEPEFNSVTKVFYDAGWTGVNVEPNPRAYGMLEQARPHDINLEAVVTYKQGPQTLYLTDDRGWSSLKPEIAESAKKRGMDPYPIEVESLTLAQVFDFLHGEECHFLKIDVEGAEEEVIASGDWKNHRPWIVVVEANVPGSNRTKYHHGKWEPYLMSRGYRFIMDDTLNRWYVADEALDKIAIGS